MTVEHTLWVDVTTLMHWRRPAVGIVRVEQQLCLYLLQASPEGLGFCVYDKYQKQFHAVSHDQVRAQLASIENYAHSGSPGSGASASPLSNEQRITNALITLIQRLPPAMGARLQRFLQRIRPSAVRLWRRLATFKARYRRVAAPVQSEATAPLTLAADSVYVSLGLDWDHKDMADIYRKKQEMGFRCLFMCYDLIPVRFPQLCVGDVSRQFAHYFADLAWTADRILCISESSRRDLQQLLAQLRVPQPSAEVIHLGGDILPRAQHVSEAVTAADTPMAPHLARPFVLFVSTIERRKNHEVLYRAWHRLAAEGLELPQLIFVGMTGWGVNELVSDMALDPSVAGKITLLHHVGDADLALLYQHALFTVYPSLYEGWGLPVGESLAFGKYCLCSNTSSLPEVGEDFVDYLDPWDLPAWVDKLRFLISNPDWVAERNADIATRYRPYPWQQTALDIYQHAEQLQSSAA